MGPSLVSSWKTSSWNTSSAVYNRTSVCIGLSRYDGGRWRLPLSSKFPSAISNLTFLTYPSSLGYTFTTLQSGHLLRVLSLSLEMTISPTARFLLGWTHFCLIVIFEDTLPSTSARIHLLNTELRRLRQYISALWNFPCGGSTLSGCIVRRWLGVNCSGASASHKLSTPKGLELIMHSTSVKSVRNVSPSSWLPACNSSGSSGVAYTTNHTFPCPAHVTRMGYVQLEWDPLASIP